MALSHTPPPFISESSGITRDSKSKCFSCNEVMSFDTQECYIISTCNHIFHRICVEEALSISSHCPECQLACQLSDLRNHSTNPIVHNEMGTQTGTKKNQDLMSVVKVEEHRLIAL